ncbi:MAG: hypothetical protein LBL26_10435 [Peptococcaceae bacterium]|jgi:hypothetical protein|nr:hypothetical protein [Peptococcaceae bacterium]
MNNALLRQISLILVPYDDLTDQIITEPVLTIYLDYLQREPIRKSEGFWIFTNLDDPVVRLKVTSDRYHTLNAVVDLTGLDPLYPVFLIRLKPGFSYARPPGSSLISGYVRDKKGTLIRQCPVTVQHSWEGGRVRLLEDTAVTGKSRLRLSAPQFNNLLGRQFIIQDVKTRILERMTIVSRHEDTDLFILDNPLSKHYPADTLMYQLTELTTDGEGGFAFYIQTPKEAGGQIKVTAKQGGKKAEYLFAPPAAPALELPDLTLQ